MTAAASNLARDCEALDQARRIANWVGDGKPVTPKGVLRPTDVRSASAEIGLLIPEKFRSAADVPLWHRLWSAALATDMVSLEGDIAVANAAYEVTLELWLTAFAAALAANFNDEEGTASLHVGRAALTALASGQVTTFEQLEHHVWHDLGSNYDHDYWMLRSAAGNENSAALLADVLMGFGAVTDERKLTELGRWALTELIRRGDDIVSRQSIVPAGQVCQLKIILQGVRPACWRRVLVPSTASLGELHGVIQAAMRWDDDHLHSFRIGEQHYGDPGYDMSDEQELTIGGAFTRTRKRIRYTYDFGDDWRHDIELERALDTDPTKRYPICVAGSGRVPVEDSVNRMIKFDQDDINRRLGATADEEAEPALEGVIEMILTDAYGEEEQLSAFLTVLEDVLELSIEASVLGSPVTVLGLDFEEPLRGPFALCRGQHGTGEITLVDVCFPPDTAAAWVHAAYRRFLGIEPFPAVPRSDWTWPPD